MPAEPNAESSGASGGAATARSAPASGPAVQRVRPGLWSLAVPIPVPGLGYVLVYAFELPDGVALVDTGWDDEASFQGLSAALEIAGFEIADVRAILATHNHPDHYGLAGRVREVSGAWIGMHEADAAFLSRMADEAGRERLRCMGSELSALIGGPSVPVPGMGSLVSTAIPDRLIADGERLRLGGWDLRAVWTPGHTPGHLCFHETGSGLLLSGDHVLPTISPNVSVTAVQRPDPLGEYLSSLMKVASAEVAGGATEVLPGHEQRFTDLRARVDTLIAHHGERLAEVEAVLAANPGATCWEVALDLRWRVPLTEQPAFRRKSALGETLAHLVRLEAAGRAHGEGRSPRRWKAS